MGEPRRGGTHWWQSGPVGLARRLLRGSAPSRANAGHKASPPAHTLAEQA